MVGQILSSARYTLPLPFIDYHWIRQIEAVAKRCLEAMGSSLLLKAIIIHNLFNIIWGMEQLFCGCSRALAHKLASCTELWHENKRFLQRMSPSIMCIIYRLTLKNSACRVKTTYPLAKIIDPQAKAYKHKSTRDKESYDSVAQELNRKNATYRLQVSITILCHIQQVIFWTDIIMISISFIYFCPAPWNNSPSKWENLGDLCLGSEAEWSCDRPTY